MMSRTSRTPCPDTLTAIWLEALGWQADQCQRQTGPVKRDLFGFADQYAFLGDHHLLVQTTTSSNLASRRKKVIDSMLALRWLRSSAYNHIFVVGWKDPTEPPRVESIHLAGEGELTAKRMNQAAVLAFTNKVVKRKC